MKNPARETSEDFSDRDEFLRQRGTRWLLPLLFLYFPSLPLLPAACQILVETGRERIAQMKRGKHDVHFTAVGLPPRRVMTVEHVDHMSHVEIAGGIVVLGVRLPHHEQRNEVRIRRVD